MVKHASHLANSSAVPAPLQNRHICVTRPADQAPSFVAQLESAGARVTVLPTISIAPVEDFTRLDVALAAIATFDWIVLTSVNGVHAVQQRLADIGITWADRQRARLAVIGPETAAALESVGATPDLVPPEYVAEAIPDGMGNVAGQKILLLRADIARRTLADMLRIRGAEVTEVPVYRTVVGPDSPTLLEHLMHADRPDAITFTSGSTVTGFLVGMRHAGLDPEKTLTGIKLAAIGPVTARALREKGLEPSIVASDYTTAGLTRALIMALGSSSAQTERE